MKDLELFMLNKYNVRQRLVNETDAEFITFLRSDKSLAKHIHYADGNVEQQVEWIRKYKEREAQGKEFYFIYESVSGERYGTLRLSDFDDHSCVIGSWLFRRDAPVGLPILCETVGKKTAFDRYDIIYVRFDVRIKNKSVVKYHDNFWNSLRITADDLNYYYILTKDVFEKKLNRVLKLLSVV